ncbi:MAG: hypothetical protein CSYNP_03370 [Syntrophus sp. SKADARSKE-3]|nr:hypothetical protein [Syntrophus sp. SKADARSKE-3]
MAPASLIIFDYSGTLSLQAPRFGRPEHLMKELDACGLTVFGIDSVDIFWNELVNPTWAEGSTTSAGYTFLLEKHIGEHLREAAIRPDQRMIHVAADCFVRRYMTYSTIDPRWIPFLQWLDTLPEAVKLIATDHYSEATAAIIAHLNKCGIKGVSLPDLPESETLHGRIIVANSADLGVHKAERGFWEIIKARLHLPSIGRILIVDDFGAHEQTGDAYGAAAGVASRRQETLDMLRNVFSAPVEAVDFRADHAESSVSEEDCFDCLIGRTIIKIKDSLSLNHDPVQCQSDQ